MLGILMPSMYFVLMNRAYYQNSISSFLQQDPNFIIGQLAQNNDFSLEVTQRNAWQEEIQILQSCLTPYEGDIFFEFSIPRMGSRIDVLLLIQPVIFVLEFKVGEKHFTPYAIDQVYDYALDLKNFHETSHHACIAPVLIATHAKEKPFTLISSHQQDGLLEPITCNLQQLPNAIQKTLEFASDAQPLASNWNEGRYCPTPTIIEAAKALYHGHNVANISRSDASAKNLQQTTQAISKIIDDAKQKGHKSICFVTGVPGAGKTLVGLNIATQHLHNNDNTVSVFLSGNGPLVKVLQEALARDQIARKKNNGEKLTKKAAHSEVKAFIQNIHHYRDECLQDPGPPADHVALFDEAQRAWNVTQTTNFMARKKNRPGFNKSEPEFLISCVDRHNDWGVVVCLVGGGQEINTGEAGIGEWIAALERSFPDWHIHISNRLHDSEYQAETFLEKLRDRENVYYDEDLHLSVSMRSFRAENVSLLVKQILDLDSIGATETLQTLKGKYPIVITRDLQKAKAWLKKQARGSERYGIVVSSSAERLRPDAIFVKAPLDPIHWFLNGKDDVRSSYYLEDVATEFSIQGLEIDWACVTWDADFRHKSTGWGYHSFSGNKWKNVRQAERQTYLKNAYRVLLTRARQGMIIVVSPGNEKDPTRNPAFYDPTFEYLQSIGFEVI